MGPYPVYIEKQKCSKPPIRNPISSLYTGWADRRISLEYSDRPQEIGQEKNLGKIINQRGF